MKIENNVCYFKLFKSYALISQFQLLTSPRADPWEFSLDGKIPTPGQKWLQNHGHLGKKLGAKRPWSPIPGAKQEPKLQQKLVIITQIFDDILIQNGLLAFVSKTSTLLFY